MAARADLGEAGGGRIRRLLSVHGAMVSAVTAATCGQRDIVAQTEGER